MSTDQPLNLDFKDRVSGQFIKGVPQNWPEHLQCDAMRSNGFRCRRRMSAECKNGKKFCPFHDRRFGAVARKNEWKRTMALKNYRAMGDLLEELFKTSLDTSSEAEILSCLDEVVLIRKSAEPALTLAARVLTHPTATDGDKMVAAATMQAAIKQVVAVVAVAAKVRETFKTTITIEQVREVTGQIVRLVAQVFGVSPEMFPLIEEFNRRVYAEIRMPTMNNGSGQMSELELSPDQLISQMSCLTIGPVE